MVVNYRTPDDLKSFFRSFTKYPPTCSWSGFVVNNDPEQEDLEVGDQSSFHHCYFSKNVGYAKAVNHAVSLGSSDVVGIFNADIEFTERSIDQCVQALQSNDEWGCLGPRQVDSRGKMTAGGIFGSNSRPQHRGWKARDSNTFEDIRDDSVTVAGSALFIKRAVWQELWECSTYRRACQEFGLGCSGVLLETPLFYEDTFACFHLRNHGYLAVYFGPSIMVHKYHKSVRKNGLSVAQEKMKESRTIFRNVCGSMGIQSH